MVLGFKEIFKKPILDGSKIHTLREDAHRRWQPGRTIHFATGVRTKKYDNFKIGVCRSVQEVEINMQAYYMTDYYVKIDGKKLTLEETQQLAWNDGFTHLINFYLFFSKEGELKKRLRLIHWTEFKY